MTILDWFDILLDGITRGFLWLAAIDIGGVSLLTYILVVFVTGLMFTLFLNVIDTGVTFGSNMVSRSRHRQYVSAIRERSKSNFAYARAVERRRKK